MKYTENAGGEKKYMQKFSLKNS